MYHHPLRSRTGVQSKCAKSHLELPAMDDVPSWADQGWKDPCLNSSPEKLHPSQSAQNSQGTFPMTRGCLPCRWQVPTTIPPMSSTRHASKCAKSHPEPPAIDEAPCSAGLGWKAPQNSQGTCPYQTESGPICNIPWRCCNSLPPSPVEQCRCEYMCQITSRACWPSTRHHLSAVFIKWQRIL